MQLITGLIHRDPTALNRAALGLAKSVLGSFLVITLTFLPFAIWSYCGWMTIPIDVVLAFLLLGIVPVVAGLVAQLGG